LKTKLLLPVYVIVLVILVTYVTFPDSLKIKENQHYFTKIVNVDKKQLFDVMADVKNYPNIFPENYVSVIIINQTDNVIFSQETVKEAGIQVTINAKHSIIPYEKHEIEILSGDAKGSKILAVFKEVDSNTKIDVKIEMKLSGLLTPFAYLPKQNIDHALNTIFTTFTTYSKLS